MKPDLKRYIIYQIDAFTKIKFKGNPAGVVLNADGLTDQQMRFIAREFNNSETAFLFAPGDDSCDGIIRYFTPTTEVPTCGHATIAAMYAKAVEENLDTCILKIRTKIGVLPFGIYKQDNDYRIAMTQGDIEIGPDFGEENTNLVLQALGLSRSDLNNKCPVQIASTGHSKVMICINSGERLNDLQPNSSALIELSKKINCNGYFVFTFDTTDDCLTTGRMFAPAIGISEDPVTGNANGPLGAYLIQNGIVAADGNEFVFKGKQGEKMGRPGIIEVRIKVEGNKPVLVQIIGEAVIIFKSIIEL